MLEAQKKAVAAHEVRMSEVLLGPDATEAQVLIDAMSRAEDDEMREYMYKYYNPEPDAISANALGLFFLVMIGWMALAIAAGRDIGIHL